ncbi:MAG: DUF4149 domain-containing protein [Nitrospirae bacterium]|nr:DUF4149 domain-containing protein [Nitrospirota bacterium]
MRNWGYFFYILTLGLWTGGVFIFTFVVTPVIFKTYARDKAGEIVGSLFPSYFIFTIGMSVLALLLLWGVCQLLTITAFRVSLGLAVMSICIALYVTLGLYPQIQDVKRSVPSFETTAEDHPMRAKFRRLHAVNSVLNLAFMSNGIALMGIGTMMKR